MAAPMPAPRARRSGPLWSHWGLTARTAGATHCARKGPPGTLRSAGFQDSSFPGPHPRSTSAVTSPERSTTAPGRLGLWKPGNLETCRGAAHGHTGDDAFMFLGIFLHALRTPGGPDARW